MDRRDFLKGTAMTAATLAASRLAYGQNKAAVEPSIATQWHGRAVEQGSLPLLRHWLPRPGGGTEWQGGGHRR